MNPKSVIALIRHGDYRQPQGVPSALLPYPLTPVGEAQARHCGKLIGEFSASHHCSIDPQLDSSRQLRAWQTASLIAEALPVEALSKRPTGDTATTIKEFEGLSERSVGAAANLDVAAIAAIVAADPRFAPLPAGWKPNSDFCLPFQGAESLRQAGARVAAHIQHAWQVLAPSELKLIVGHGAAIRHACAQLGILSEADIADLSMHHAQPVFVSCDEQGKWHRVAGDWKIRQHAGDELGE